MGPTGRSPIDLQWDSPALATFLRRVASFSRFITFDRRGWGASDSASHSGLSPWEEWTDDIRAVLDAVGSERAAILGAVDGGATAILFAATEPQRTQALLLFTATARSLVDDGYPGLPKAASDDVVRFMASVWGTEAFAEMTIPSADQAARRWIAKSGRLYASPRDAAAYFQLLQSMDIRDVVSSVRVPTLVMHRSDFTLIPVEQGRYIADHIPGARFVLVPGADGALYTEPAGEILDTIEEFLTGARPLAEPDRILAAVLFTDIVGSTEKAAALGDRRWKDLLESHDTLARTIIDQHRGRWVKSTGDGILATFDGPGRAIRCALALQEALRALGIEIRAGLHTGEVELRGEDIGGIGVHVAARVLEHAGSGELLASAAVPLLVAGSGIEFSNRGSHTLKGVPGEWRLFAVQT